LAQRADVREGRVSAVPWTTAREQILTSSPIAVRVELHPEARAEVRAAALWYDKQRPGLGDRFIERFDEVLHRLP
jgi:hypothetical protein